MNRGKPTVFIVDDDRAVLNALASAVRAEHYPCVTYHSAEAFLAATHPEQAGCLVLDDGMPGMSGLELQELMVERGYIMAVIFITGQGDIPRVVKAMKQGAVDFLEKPFSLDVLLDRIATLLECRPFDAPRGLEFARADSCGHDQGRTGLTRREQEVLDHIMAGESNKVAARQLGISPRTIEAHRARIMHKLGVHSTAELMRLAFEQNMIADREV